MIFEPTQCDHNPFVHVSKIQSAPRMGGKGGGRGFNHAEAIWLVKTAVRQ